MARDVIETATNTARGAAVAGAMVIPAGEAAGELGRAARGAAEFAGAASVATGLQPGLGFAGAGVCEPHWYALYTCANHEKRVAAELGARTVEHFLPVYSSARRWKDRRVTLDLPLFPGYVFVRLALRDRLRVAQIPSAVRLVGFGGLPAALPDTEMEILRAGLSPELRMEPHPFLTAGRRVRVKTGPLAGLRGILVRRKSGARFVVSVELILRSMAVEVDEADLEAVA